MGRGGVGVGRGGGVAAHTLTQRSNIVQMGNLAKSFD